MAVKLTIPIVREARPRIGPDGQPRDTYLFDSVARGLVLRVTPSGTKTFNVVYRYGKGRKAPKRKVALGEFGKPWTLDAAREEAQGILADAKRGEDRATTVAETKRAITVAELCDRYLAAVEDGHVLTRARRPKKPSTLATDKGRMLRHIKPLLGRKLARDVTRADIERFMRDVRAGKTKADVKTGLRGRAIVEGGRGTATRTVGLLGGIFSFAVREGIREANPVRGVQREADRRRNRFLSPAEYRALGQALDAGSDANSTAAAAVRLLAFTGARKGEILELRWDQVDVKGRCLRLADTKTGASIRPLGIAAIAVLKGLPRIEGNPYVLPGHKKGRHYIGVPRWFADLTERMKLDNVVLHTLRHSFATVANELGFTEATIAAMLGHRVHSVTGRYTHHLDATLVAAADKVSERIKEYMTGKSERGAVVPLRPAAEKSRRGR